MSSPSAATRALRTKSSLLMPCWVFLDVVDKLTMHRRHPVVTEIRHRGHGHAEPLHLLWAPEMTEDLGGISSLRLSIKTAAISIPAIWSRIWRWLSVISLPVTWFFFFRHLVCYPFFDDLSGQVWFIRYQARTALSRSSSRWWNRAA